MVGISTLLTYKTVEAQEPLVIARDIPGIQAQVEQQPQGKSCQCLSYSQELSLIIFICLIMVFTRFVIMTAMVRIERRLRHRVARCVGKTEKDQRMYKALYWIGHWGVIVSLIILFHFGVSFLDERLRVAIMGA